MADESNEPIIKPLNTHATSAPADILGTDGKIKPLNTHATSAPAGETEDKTDNTHATSEPAN
ncbi:hypothetical protein E6P78_01270 [Streptomyces sp. A0958]|uniref:hypothetical protein n=1 Tax=unclassified Streptomyces TaxID=2593676 RepID=UPI00109E4868|nr:MULTISPECIES: hypothetical protein [unclassified Streptomyces]THA28120.1 hypothetical protein E6R18_29100 [Streptomyces sp. A1277]THA72798.1 hypothetical protein E6P78_01270 [Streptomyces sp. A0958]